MLVQGRDGHNLKGAPITGMDGVPALLPGTSSRRQEIRSCVRATTSRRWTPGRLFVHRLAHPFLEPLLVRRHRDAVRIGQAILPPAALEAGIARMLARLQATKEGFQRRIPPARHIVDHLSVQ
jgi:hypothetical protein